MIAVCCFPAFGYGDINKRTAVYKSRIHYDLHGVWEYGQLQRSAFGERIRRYSLKTFLHDNCLEILIALKC